MKSKTVKIDRDVLWSLLRLTEMACLETGTEKKLRMFGKCGEDASEVELPTARV